MSTDKVVYLSDIRKQAGAPTKEEDREWLFSLDIYRTPDSFEASCTGFNDGDGLEVGSRMQLHAKALEELFWILRQQAEGVEPSPDGNCLCALHIYESSRVRMRSDQEKISSSEQVDWLLSRLEDAKELAEDIKSLGT